MEVLRFLPKLRKLSLTIDLKRPVTLTKEELRADIQKYVESGGKIHQVTIKTYKKSKPYKPACSNIEV